MSEYTNPDLVLGWRVDSEGSPLFWLDENATSGGQNDSHVISIPRTRVANHSVIIAQSGSGKSFLLGRLVEELVLKTRARCLILDPNGDFRRIHETQAETLWDDARYDVRTGSGRLPTEARRQDFLRVWEMISKRVLTSDKRLSQAKPYEPLKIWWPSTSVDFITEGLEPLSQIGIFHCHNFVKSIAKIVRWVRLVEREKAERTQSGQNHQGLTKPSVNVLRKAQQLLMVRRKRSGPFSRTLQRELVPRELLETEGATLSSVFVHDLILPELQVASEAAQYVTPDSIRFYFAKVSQYKTLMSERPVDWEASERSITVVDLPSLEGKNTRLIAVNAILEQQIESARDEWNKAMKVDPLKDKRVPTFVVVDEAHNLVPAVAQTRTEETLRDQFRTLAAEGRKLGLFLILASQRPDKLDSFVLSECENKAIMRVSSKALLKAVRSNLGLEEDSSLDLEQCTRFRLGRVLFYGEWSRDGPRSAFCAARRTVEGGRNLRTEYWANPPRDPG